MQTEVIVAQVKDEPYYCERCCPRDLEVEIPLRSGTDKPDQTYFLTLQREDGLLLRKNDTVYVLRELPVDERFLADGTPRPRLTYRNAGALKKEECDIFRIESLWKDGKGDRIVMGYNYLRPHETHHEPSRRFYPNEILKAPIHEIINIEMIDGRCWVVDTNTYCKGRPIDCVEEHVYICDLRVNKTATSFAKTGKQSQAICTKPFAFQHFETRIKINRNVHPHGPPSPDFKVRPTPQLPFLQKKPRKSDKKNGRLSEYEKAQIGRKRWIQRETLHGVVARLEERIPNFFQQPLDLSHLLVKEVKKRGKQKSYGG